MNCFSIYHYHENLKSSEPDLFNKIERFRKGEIHHKRHKSNSSSTLGIAAKTFKKKHSHQAHRLCIPFLRHSTTVAYVSHVRYTNLNLVYTLYAAFRISEYLVRCFVVISDSVLSMTLVR